ncbi:unnamed protein product [Arabidopsis lyrata]|nr:unnamed protein product [Arabidopsis lyrata]
MFVLNVVGVILIHILVLKTVEENCLVDEQKPPGPIVVEKADERVGDVSEEDVFTDAVCEFSRSDSFKEETATNFAAKGTENPGETQQCNNSSTAGVMKSPKVVQESCEVPPVEILENYDGPPSVEAASDDRQGEEFSTEGHSIVSETVIESSSQEAQVIDGGDTISNDRLDTECKGKLTEESESKLASALGKREDTSDSSWNDEVIYSDVEGPYGFSSEATSMTHPGEASCIGSEDVPVHTSPVKADATQVISASQSVPDDMPFVENADVSLHGIKGVEEFEASHSVNPYLPETSKGEECENTLTDAENLGIHPEGLSIGSEVPSSDKLFVGDKTEPQGQTDLVAIKEFPSAENIMISMIDSEDIEMKAEEGESSLGNAHTVESETLRVSLPAVDSIVVDSNADVSSAANKTGLVDLVGHESELIQANVVAEEGINPKDTLSSESSCFVSPVSVVFEGDDASDKIKSSSETSKDSALQIGAEFCESKDEVCREINNGRLVKERSFINETNTTEYPIGHSGSTGTAPDTVNTANQKSLESGRTEFNRVVGGLGVIQANEIDGNVQAQNYYAEVPVTIESNDHRDFGRLQNLSEAHIRSLVSSPLVTRNNTSNAFESNLGSVSGVSGGVNKPENASQNQEITLEKTTSWSTEKEQHVPLKNLLSEARSPRLQQQQAKDHESNNVPRVSSILGQETSPEDGRWPEKREVSEEWNSPAKYPVDFKREEKKVKGRPFWVPFVCCSNVK